MLVVLLLLYVLDMVTIALEQMGKMLLSFSILTVLGAIAGFTRQKIRKRWPDVLDAGKVDRRGKAGEGSGIQIDQLLIPLFFSWLVWLVLIFVDNRLVGLIDMLVIAYPFFVILSIPFWAFWSFIQTGLLGWLGGLSRQQYLELEAREVLLQDDLVQPWLDQLTITADPAGRRYIISGSLPDQKVMAAVIKLLQGFNLMEIDTTAVKIDPHLLPGK